MGSGKRAVAEASARCRMLDACLRFYPLVIRPVRLPGWYSQVPHARCWGVGFRPCGVAHRCLLDPDVADHQCIGCLLLSQPAMRPSMGLFRFFPGTWWTIGVSHWCGWVCNTNSPAKVDGAAGAFRRCNALDLYSDGLGVVVGVGEGVVVGVDVMLTIACSGACGPGSVSLTACLTMSSTSDSNFLQMMFLV